MTNEKKDKIIDRVIDFLHNKPLKSDMRIAAALIEELKLVKNCSILAVSGWLEFEGNESIFNEYAKRNCVCKFDDGTECRYEDKHPMAILTHFRCK